MFRNGNLKYGFTLSRRFLHIYEKRATKINVCVEECNEQKPSKIYCAPMQVPEGLMEVCDLRNGMRIISERKESRLTTVGFILPAGSMYETPEERGSALFMEHLMFRKTQCRLENEIEEELEEIGGKITAVAMRDMFLFYGTAPNEGVDKLIELFADATLRGCICNDDFMYEKLVLMQELCKMERKHEKVVMDYLSSTAYQDTELSKSIYSETCEIRDLTQEKVECFRQRLFKPCFMTMISTGGTSLCKLYRFAEKHFLDSKQEFKTIDGLCTLKTSIPMPSFRFTGGEMRLRDDDEELGHVAIAVEGPGYAKCEDHCTLTVAKEFVGSWDLSYAGAQHNAPYIAHRAFNSDICHKYKSFNIGWTNTGLFGCYFACDRMKLDDMISMIQREWMRLCTSITQKEVERAVNQCKTKELLRLCDPIQKFLYIASCLFYRGYYESITHRIMKYEKVSAKSLKEVASKYIYDQCPAVVAVGPIENLPDYILMRSKMYLIRY